MATDFDTRSLRKRIGWSQEKLAAYLGINRSNVSRIETNGQARGPILKLLTMLRDAADRGDDAVNELWVESTGGLQ